jgi:hypothetical protein
MIFVLLFGVLSVATAERECVVAALDAAQPVTHSFECSRLFHRVVALAAASLSEHRAPCNEFATSCAVDTCRLSQFCNDTSCEFDESQIRAAVSPLCAAPSRASMALLAVCAPSRRGYGDLCTGQPNTSCVDVTFDARTAHSTVVPPNSAGFGRTVSRGPLRNVLQWRAPAYVFPERNVDAAPQRWFAWLADVNVAVNGSGSDAAFGVAFAVNQSVTQQHYAALWRSSGVVELVSIEAGERRVLANATGQAQLRDGVWANLQVQLAGDQVAVMINADAMANDSQRTVALTTRLPSVPPRGFVGIVFSDGSGLSDDFTVRRFPVAGKCGDGVCDPQADEDCITCAHDCVAPCGCGDKVCWGDEEVVSGCFDCRPVVVSNRDASQRWWPRSDGVAAFFSFDSVQQLGADDSGNGLNLGNGAAVTATTERCVRGSCAAFSGGDGLALAAVPSAYGRLPVGASPITMMLFARFEPPLAESRRKSAPLLQFGNAADGTQSLVTAWRNETHGRVRWLHGSLSLDVSVDWAKAGLRQLAFTHSNGSLRIRVDELTFDKSSCANNGIAPVMTTFGRLTVGGDGFAGVVDELVILANSVSDDVYARHGSGGNWTVVRTPVRQTSDGDDPSPEPAAPRVFEDCNNFRTCDECVPNSDCSWCDVSGCAPLGADCSGGAILLVCSDAPLSTLGTTGAQTSNSTRISEEEDQENLMTSVAVLVGSSLSLCLLTGSLLMFLHCRGKRFDAKYGKLANEATVADTAADVEPETSTVN